MKELIQEWVSEGLDYFEIQDKLVARMPLGESRSVIEELMSYAGELIELKRVKAVGSTTEEIGDYYSELLRHDWFYEYSDDHSVWRRGSQNHDYLRNKSYESLDYFKMFREYTKYINQKRERPTLEEFVNH